MSILSMASGFAFGLQNATLTGKVICGLLVFLSVASWVAMISKFRLLRRAREANGVFYSELKRSPHPLAFYQAGERFDLSPMFHVYGAACRELCFYLLGTDQVDGTFSRRLQAAGRITLGELNAVRDSMERAVGEAALRLEGRLGIVASALSGAPVLGLLGTVWGVMDSFANVGAAPDAAGLAALAPGLSTAMLTTVAGLLVAIPSMFGYNFLVTRIREQIARVEHFSGEFASILGRHFVDHRGLLAEASVISEVEGLSVDAFAGAPSGMGGGGARK